MSQRHAANAANAQLSTGPRTAAGKERSKRNSLRHGLASDAVLMPWEDKTEYEALIDEYTAQYRPWGEIECELLRRVVDCFWRLRRAERVQTTFLKDREKSIRESSNGQLSGDSALASLFSDAGEMRKLSLAMRYVASAERAFTKAMKAFEEAQRFRLEQAVVDNIAELGRRAAAIAKPPSPTGANGFVSQSTPAEHADLLESCRPVPHPDGGDPHAYMKIAIPEGHPAVGRR